MRKLVDNPLDAAPSLPLLIPALTQNAESISDPEAREVSNKALNRGRVYGLPGGYDSRKSTLMCTLANNQVEGFPDMNEVDTMFV